MINSIIKKELQNISDALNIPYYWLYNIIKFESNFSPTIKNPNSSARGLIQVIDSSARELGYKSSYDMVLNNPTVKGQLRNVVLKYLKKKFPFLNKADFYMSIFYPKYRGEHYFKEFPKLVKEKNPNIRNINDYIRFVDKNKNNSIFKGYYLLFILMLGGFYWIKKQQNSIKD